MKTILRVIVFLFFPLVATSAFAQTPTACISRSNLQKIANDFAQFAQFLGKKSEYCEADIDVRMLKLANSLVVLLDSQPKEPALDISDALTYKAISENNWWAYLTNRASRFVIEAGCPEGVVAFVQPSLGDATIHVCEFYFDISTSSQASTLMHEARHFDGHHHVTCSQGNELGMSGACDSAITNKGSYAVTVQTLVGMARSSVTAPSDVPMLEAEAIYSAFNKFNAVPQVKIHTSIILSNNSGEVFDWNLGQELRLIKQLSEPAVVNNSSNNLTIYPVDTNSDAYRRDKALVVEIENPGLYAKHYNSESPLERQKYKSISYNGSGGLLKGNSLLSLCNVEKEVLELSETNLDDKGQFTAIISMSKDAHDQTRESFLLADNGDVYRYECEGTASDVVLFEKTELRAPAGGVKILNSFGLDGEQYALLGDGSLAILAVAGNALSLHAANLPVDNKDWVSATPFSQAEVF